MKSIEAKEQVNLGWFRALQLALSGMLYRFFRSGVTAAILCLAVAFLVHTLVHGLLSQSTVFHAHQELKEHRSFGRVASRLSRPDSARAVVDAFARKDSDRLGEYRVWGDLTEEEKEEMQEVARRVSEARSFFEHLPDDQRAILVGDTDITTLLRQLRSRVRYSLLAERIEDVGLHYPLAGESDFRKLVEVEWPWFSGKVESIQSGQQAAISEVRDAYPDYDINTLLIVRPDDFSDNLRKAGFETEDMAFDDLAFFAGLEQGRDVLESMLTDRRIQIPLKERIGVPEHELSTHTVFEWLVGRRGDAGWLSELLDAAGVEISSQRLLNLSGFFNRSGRLQNIAEGGPPAEDIGIFSMEGHLPWLILLAFLVCVVGVANAMLMSVTERFTEIATMKCLGALDGFVMMMFVFEAAIQGLIGGTVGVLLGIMLAFFRGYAEYGRLLVLTRDVWSQILFSSVLALAAGIILASFAAIGPSLIAARLAPMEAMRVE